MESQNYWRKKKMKKKVLLIALLVALILAPVTAASYRGSEKNGTFGVGLNLGTNTGVGLKFGMGDFDILANIGLSNFQVSADRFSLAGDIAASYEVYDVDFGKGHHMPITVGGGVTMGFTIGDQFGLDLSVVVPVGALDDVGERAVRKPACEQELLEHVTVDEVVGLYDAHVLASGYLQSPIDGVSVSAVGSV